MRHKVAYWEGFLKFSGSFRRLHPTFFVLVFCLFSGTAVPVHSLGQRELNGRVSPEVVGDSLVIEYELYRSWSPLDSLLFALRCVDSTKNDVSPEAFAWHQLSPVTADSVDPRFGFAWEGRLVLPWLKDAKPNNYMLRLFRSAREGLPADSGLLVDNLLFEPAKMIGREINLGLSWFTRGGFPPPVHSTAYGVAGHVEDKFGYRGHGFAILAGYGGDYSKRFVFFDLPRLEAYFAPAGWVEWQPIFHVGATYTRLKGVEGDDQVKYKGYGGEIGVRMDGPFESFRYSYNSAVGGYHRADLVLAIESKVGGVERVGTIFSYFRGDHVRMFMITAYMEGWGFRNDRGEALFYHNDRPWWHKGLSLAGWLPFLPIALAMLGSS